MGLMSEVDLENYADVLFWSLGVSRRKPFRNGDTVLIRYDIQAAPLAEAVYSRLISGHMHPFALANPTPAMEADLFRNSSFGQLVAQMPGLEALYGETAGVVTILAPSDLGHLQDADPRTIAEGRAAARPLMGILERRRRLGKLGWTTCLYPTEALARAAGVGLEEYARLLERACYLNMSDPLREWRRIKGEVDALALELDGLEASGFHLESENMDLTVETGRDRRFVGFNGVNVPGYELYIAPDCRRTRGVYYADQPSILYGRLVHGVRLEFYDGVAVRAEAEKGAVFLQNQLYSDSGARRVGEFSLTDKRISRVDQFMAHTLLDENFGGENGNCHLALGASAVESYTGPPEILTSAMEAELGLNSSALHWDFVNTEPKRVSALLPGGRHRLVYESGEFRL